MKSESASDNKAAARYGFARIGVSTPDGHWTFGLVLHVQLEEQVDVRGRMDEMDEMD